MWHILPRHVFMLIEGHFSLRRFAGHKIPILPQCSDNSCVHYKIILVRPYKYVFLKSPFQTSRIQWTPYQPITLVPWYHRNYQVQCCVCYPAPFRNAMEATGWNKRRGAWKVFYYVNNCQVAGQGSFSFHLDKHKALEHEEEKNATKSNMHK